MASVPSLGLRPTRGAAGPAGGVTATATDGPVLARPLEVGPVQVPEASQGSRLGVASTLGRLRPSEGPTAQDGPRVASPVAGATATRLVREAAAA